MIDVVIFAGFLGAGKTTVLGRLVPALAGRRRTALLVNDFGSLPIDGALLEKHGVPLREISGGSIFCVCKQADLLRQLTDIATAIQPEILLIEASGLAEPTDTAALLQNTFLRDLYGRPRVVTVVDALNYRKLSHVLRVIDMQIQSADAVIISKTDLADPAPVEEAVRVLNPSARIVLSDAHALHGELDMRSCGTVDAAAPSRLCATATPGFSVVNFSAASIDIAGLNLLLDEFHDVILRAKGVANGRRLDLVNGAYAWSDDPPAHLPDGLFFALRGDATAFEQRLNGLVRARHALPHAGPSAPTSPSYGHGAPCPPSTPKTPTP